MLLHVEGMQYVDQEVVIYRNNLMCMYLFIEHCT